MTKPTRKDETKNPRIAVATVSGKAYYLLVNELRKRGESFISLTPNDEIPVYIKVVITTKEEGSGINHQNTLEYAEDANPVEIVEEAIRLVKGRESYEHLVIGIDPGSSFGVAVLGDKSLIETKNCFSVAETVKVVDGILKRIPAAFKTVRVGDGIPSIAEELLCHLNNHQRDVTFEIVSEEGTSQSLGKTPQRRGKRDISSAIKIAQRLGRNISKRKS